MNRLKRERPKRRKREPTLHRFEFTVYPVATDECANHESVAGLLRTGVSSTVAHRYATARKQFLQMLRARQKAVS